MSTPLVIFIAGPSGSGKTTLARGLYNTWGSDKVLTLSSDYYYKCMPDLSFAEREQQNYDAPSSIDIKLMSEHLQQLKAGASVEVPEYDFKQHARSGKTIIQKPKPIIIVEGILILAIESLREQAEHKIYLDTQLDVCLMRRIRRDCMERGRTVESVLNQYEKTVHPMLVKYVLPSRQYANFLFEDGGPVPGAMSHLNQLIGAHLDQLIPN